MSHELLRENVQEILNVVDITASGAGLIVSTGTKGRYTGTPKCRFLLNVTGFAGTSMLVEVKTTINGVDVLVGAFTSVTGVVQESIEIDNCPINVKIVYTAVAVTDFDATVHSVRF